MNSVLKKQSLKRLLPMLLISAILAVALLAVSIPGLLKLAIGPKPLTEQNLEDLDGSYVSVDASDVIVAFATLSVTSDDDTQTLQTYYLLPGGDGTYLAVMDTKEEHGDVLDQAMDQSYEYYMGDLETLTPLGNIQGTATELDEDMLDYMVECIEKYELPGYTEDGDTYALIRPVQIQLGYAGFLRSTYSIVLGIVGAVFLIIFLILLVPTLAGAYQKKAASVVLADHSQEEAEELFQAAEQIERIRVGAYIWYQKGATTHVLKTSDLIWGYTMPEPLVVSKYRWPVALYDMQQNQTQICFQDKKSCEKFLSAIAAQGHPFVNGYTTAYAQQFQENFEEFAKQAAK
jgi:hypothetical protein